MMPTNDELILTGLYDFKKRLNSKVHRDIEAYTLGRMSLSDLTKYLITADKELTETQKRIDKLSPPFAADDIPF